MQKDALSASDNDAEEGKWEGRERGKGGREGKEDQMQRSNERKKGKKKRADHQRGSLRR